MRIMPLVPTETNVCLIMLQIGLLLDFGAFKNDAALNFRITSLYPTGIKITAAISVAGVGNAYANASLSPCVVDVSTQAARIRPPHVITNTTTPWALKRTMTSKRCACATLEAAEAREAASLRSQFEARLAALEQETR